MIQSSRAHGGSSDDAFESITKIARVTSLWLSEKYAPRVTHLSDFDSFDSFDAFGFFNVNIVDAWPSSPETSATYGCASLVWVLLYCECGQEQC